MENDFVNVYENANNSPKKQYAAVINTHWSGYNGMNYNTANNPNRHEIENYMQAAYMLGHKGGVPKQWVGRWKWQGSFNGKKIGIHSGCFGGIWEKKQWNGFKALVYILIKKGYDIYSFGNENERDVYPHNSKGQYFDFAGQYTLSKTVEEMSDCDYFIANDSGLMHIADALGIPTIAIFGPTLVVKNRPVNKNSLVIQAAKGWKPECIPCQYTKNFSECNDNVCLKNISAEFVFDQFIKLREELINGI